MLHQNKSINIANLINKALYWSFFVQGSYILQLSSQL